jgi:hypothetical protein
MISNEKLRLIIARATRGKVMLTDEDIQEARDFLAALDDIQFGTLRGKMSVYGGVVSVLAVENTEMHNGDFARFVDDLKAKYGVVVFQCVMNQRLRGWLRRNGFYQASNEQDFVWQKEDAAHFDD